MREKNSWNFYLCISHRCLTKDGHGSSPMSLNSQLMEELQGSQLNDNNILNFPLLTQVNVFTSRRLTHPRAAWEEGEKCPWTEDFESLGGPATRSVNTRHISPVTEDVGGRGRLLMPRSVHVTLIHWGWSGTPHEQSQSNWNLLEVSKFHLFLAPGPRPGDIGEGLTRWEQFPWTSLVVQWVRIHLSAQGTWFDSWSGTIPHAVRQLTLCSATREATARGQQRRCRHREQTCRHGGDGGGTTRE